MSEPNDRLERAYRSLAREEPPASLDAEILAAARRALARPSMARRWGVPVSIAAVVMLAVGVTLEMQHEEPGIEISTPAHEGAGVQPAAPEAQPAVKPAQEGKREAAAPEAKREPAAAAPEPRQEKPKAFAAPRLESRRKDATSAAAPRAVAPEASRASVAPAQPQAPAPSVEGAPVSPSTAEGRFAAPAASMAKRSAAPGASADTMASTSPVAELERIAKLREEGRDAEADRALEEFRKRFPGYRIDEAMWRRVKPR